MKKDIYIVGCGGIGTHLVHTIVRGARSISVAPEINMILIDGDTIESRNLARQLFSTDAIGVSKADAILEEITVGGIAPQNLNIRTINEFVTHDNVQEIFRNINEDSIIIMGVDKYWVRNAIAGYLNFEFEDFTLINAGNEYTDGSIQITVKRGGKYITPAINNPLHPEILFADEETEERQLSCGVSIENGNAQVIYTNSVVANLSAKFIIDMIENWTSGVNYIPPAEIWFDLAHGTMKYISADELFGKIGAMQNGLDNTAITRVL